MSDTKLDGTSQLNQFIYRELPMDKCAEARKLIDSEVLSVLAELKKQSHTIAMYPDGNGEYPVVPLSAIEEQERKYKG